MPVPCGMLSSLNCPSPPPLPLPTVPTTPVMLAYSGVTGSCFKMIACISGGSNPANDASRWRGEDPLEAKANTSACLLLVLYLEPKQVLYQGGLLHWSCRPLQQLPSKRRFMKAVL